MDYLQYLKIETSSIKNTTVLNLVINGLPSILSFVLLLVSQVLLRFKPCYKWITFNTYEEHKRYELLWKRVLNLVINGLPSIQVVLE